VAVEISGARLREGIKYLGERFGGMDPGKLLAGVVDSNWYSMGRLFEVVKKCALSASTGEVYISRMLGYHLGFKDAQAMLQNGSVAWKFQSSFEKEHKNAKVVSEETEDRYLHFHLKRDVGPRACVIPYLEGLLEAFLVWEGVKEPLVTGQTFGDIISLVAIWR